MAFSEEFPPIRSNVILVNVNRSGVYIWHFSQINMSYIRLYLTHFVLTLVMFLHVCTAHEHNRITIVALAKHEIAPS